MNDRKSLFDTAHPMSINEAHPIANKSSTTDDLSAASIRAAYFALKDSEVLENKPRVIIVNLATVEQNEYYLKAKEKEPDLTPAEYCNRLSLGQG